MNPHFRSRAHALLRPGLRGVKLADLRAAFCEAQNSARQLAADMLAHDQPLDGEQFEISDDDGAHLMTVRWIDTVEFEDVYLP
jgi:hypothetical protein